MTFDLGIIEAAATLDASDFEGKLSGLAESAERALSGIDSSPAVSEIENVGSAASEASDAVQTIGENAEDAGQKTVEAAKEAGENIDSLAKKAAKAAAAFFGIQKAIGLLSASFKKFTIQEDAVVSLERSLQNAGAETETYSRRLQRLAAELQKVTKHGDEATLAAMSQAMNLGISASQMEEVTKAAMGLAAAIGVDLNTAMSLMVRANAGHTETLAKYGITLDGTLTKEQRFQQLLEIGKQKFPLAEAKSASDKLQQMGNAVGDTGEAIGRMLSTAVMPLVGGITKLSTAFNNMRAPAQRTTVAVAGAAATILLLRTSIGAAANQAVILAVKNAMLALSHIAAAAAAAKQAGVIAVLKVGLLASAKAAAAFLASLGPIGWAAIAIAGAAAAVWLLGNSAEKTQKQYEGMTEALDKANDALREGDASRKADLDKIERLQQLAKYERLNSNEQAEALKLIKQLNNEYGVQVGEIDAVTGKLNLQSEAVSRLRAEMQEQRRQELQARIDAAKAKVEAASGKVIEAANSYNRYDALNSVLRLPGVIDFDEAANGKRLLEMNEAQAAMDEANAQLRSATAEMENFKNGLNLITAQAEDNATAAANEAQRAAKEEIENTRWQIEFDTADAAKQLEMLKSKAATLSEELFASAGNKREEDYTADEIGKLKQIEEIRARVNQMTKESADAFRQEQDSFAEEQARRSEELAQRKFDERLRLMEKAGDTKGIDQLLTSQLEQARAAANQAAQAYEQARKDAAADGIMTAEEREKLSEARQKLNEATRKQDESYAKLAENRLKEAERRAQKEMERQRKETEQNRQTVGSFSLRGFAAMVGNGSPMAKTAQNTREMVKSTKKVEERTREIYKKLSEGITVTGGEMEYA
ncbi:MAG: hypothetical protein J5654_09715 [Victivallales bacterium]|nr:hypothetical protein [Victivallales bacterium]